MKRLSALLLPALLGLLAGCAEYKEYTYKEFPIAREQAYDAMKALMEEEGYIFVEQEENFVNGLPEVYLESDWNLRQTGGYMRGTDQRRKAYVKITTVYSERKGREFQPLNEDQGKKLRELEGEDKKYATSEADRKKAELDQTRIGIAVRLERQDNIDRPLVDDWIYEGPDNLAVAELMGRFEAHFNENKQGGAIGPSPRGEKAKEEELRARNR